MIDLSGLNERQREAVLHGEDPLLVIAGAGSGKTRVVTMRIAHLVDERGVAPGAVLAITFTKKAAGEMKDRLTALLGERVKPMMIATFHSACLQILRPHVDLVGLRPGFTIYDEDDTRKLIRNCTEDLELDPKQVSPAATHSKIDDWKNRLITPAKAAELSLEDKFDSQRARIYRAYQDALVDNNAVDFNDILMLTERLFRENPKVLDHFQRRFEWLFVDEYQDTNVAQNALVRQLGGAHRRVCVVGDVDQSIYAFRGAEVANILAFERMFPGARVVKLEQNYRSTKHILDAANAVIANNTERPEKNLWTSKEGGAQIVTHSLYSHDDEASWVAQEIVKLQNRGRKGGEIAVLCRTKDVGRGVERALISREVPCKLVGGISFLERSEIRDLLAYLKLVVNPADEVSFRRVVNSPRRGIGDSSVKKIRSYARYAQIPLDQAIRRGGALEIPRRAEDGLAEFVGVLDEARRMIAVGAKTDAVLRAIISATRFRQDLDTLGGDEARWKLENVDQLVDMSMAHHDVQTFLDVIGLAADTDEIEETRRVLIMTIHASKGLEFPIVFVPAMEDGVFPDARSSLNDADLEEERRLCYVAITRAQEWLYLTLAQSRMTHGQWSRNPPSRFLDEIPPHLVREVEVATAYAR